MEQVPILVAVQDTIPTGSCPGHPRWETRSGVRAAALSGGPGSRVAFQEMRADWRNSHQQIQTMQKQPQGKARKRFLSSWVEDVHVARKCPQVCVSSNERWRFWHRSASETCAALFLREHYNLLTEFPLCILGCLFSVLPSLCSLPALLLDASLLKDVVKSLCFSHDVSQAWMRIDSSIDHKKGQNIVEERVQNFQDILLSCSAGVFCCVQFFCHERGTATEGRKSWSKQDLMGWNSETRQVKCGVDWGRFLTILCVWGAHLQHFFWKWKDFLSEKRFSLAVKGLIGSVI